MRTQRIRYATDAMATQGRAILHLVCGHNVSVIVEKTPDDPDPLATLREWDCPRCSDPSPEEVRETKSASQLWREDGEP